jgi:predicted membrane chloride channel (bestrophin family)
MGDNVPGFMRDLGDTDLDVIGGFLSFFLVIFVNQSNLRFNEMYKLSMSCTGKIYDVAQSVAVSLPHANALRLVRYLNAAHTAGYVGLSQTYSKEEFFDYLNRSHCFLSRQDLSRIGEMEMDYGPDAYHEILQWCMMDINAARDAQFIEPRDASALKEKIIQFRGSMGSLYDYCDQPIHFFYIHFLVLLSTCYLPLFAIDSAYNAGSGEDIHIAADILNGMIVVLQSIFVIGLRLLGQKMVDPYGDDLEDLSVLHYIRETWQKSNRILAAQRPEAVDPAVEERLEKQKVSIGYAWESKKETGMKAA